MPISPVWKSTKYLAGESWREELHAFSATEKKETKLRPARGL